MRIVIDLQACQTGSRFRGIGRYSLSLAQALVRNRGEHEIILALSALMPDTVESLRNDFDGLLPARNILVWHAHGPVREGQEGNRWRREAAERLREAFLASLEPDMVYVSSFFEGYLDDAVATTGSFADSFPTVTTLYDLIPLLNPGKYLHPDRAYEKYYRRKLEHFARADGHLAISESSAMEGEHVLGLPKERVCNIAAACEPLFGKKKIPADFLATRFGIRKPYVLHAGSAEERKNLPRLVRAFSSLPPEIRGGYHLVLAGGMPEDKKQHLADVVRSAGLNDDECLFTGHITDEELIALYTRCTLFVFPSWHEGFGLPALEAMNCQAPVIGSNTSSLPEVIGWEEALFNPFDERDIARKIQRALTDDDYRRRLVENGATQSMKFSWDRSAKKALGFFESIHKKTLRNTTPIPACARSPSLAFVSPLPPDRSGAAEYGAALFPQLEKFYEITLVIDQNTMAEPPTHLQYPVKDGAWLQKNHRRMDRIVYNLAADASCAWMLPLPRRVPGVVLLHDFFLDELYEQIEEHTESSIAWQKAILRSHGYAALSEHIADRTGPRFPSNLGVLENAIGILATSKRTGELAETWYGRGAATRIHTLPAYCAARHNPLVPHPENAPDCFKAIERFYANAPSESGALIRSIARIQDVPPSEEELRAVACAIEKNHPRRTLLKQFFVDISELVQRDAGSGIQRVTKNILTHLLRMPPPGYRIEPVYATVGEGYRYARRFTLRMLRGPEEWAEDDPLEPSPGDIFFGLDYQPQVIPARSAELKRMQQRGVGVWFMVYDLLPVRLPEAFPPEAESIFSEWLQAISSFSGVVCISQSVADDFQEWIKEHGTESLCTPPLVGWYHLGADITRVNTSKALPEDAIEMLEHLTETPGFLMVGTIEPRKAHAQALDAFEILWREGMRVSLVIVGKQGWMTDALVRRICSHEELGKRLFWLRNVGDEYLERLYGSAVCLLFPSRGEGFGLPLIEAAKYGLPILARDIPVFREVAGDHALYFSGNEGNDLADAVKKWFAMYNENTHPKSGEMPRCTWEQSAERIVEQILGHPR